jgi:glycosyltransferase involved in cell wall biosynthesis
MLTVALDAAHTRHSSAGIARYARSLAAALRHDPGLRVLELGGGEVVERASLSKKLLTARHDLLWYPMLARRAARVLGADVYHSPLLRGPLTAGRPPFVMTVHDLVPVRWPETMPRWHRWYTARVMRKLLDAADMVIAVSEDTADDLTSLLQVRQEKIRVVPNGVEPFFFEAVPDRGPVREPYVLFVGTPEPRKNLDGLFAAMTVLKARGVAVQLVVVGAGGWGTRPDLDSGARWMGRVSDDELRALYANAACLALPSLHEGFGLPALEAMAAGTPVVAARSGALPEVTGGAAVLVDPGDATAIADGIEVAIVEGERLRTLGRARAREFTWRKAAELTAAVYREVA